MKNITKNTVFSKTAVLLTALTLATATLPTAITAMDSSRGSVLSDSQEIERFLGFTQKYGSKETLNILKTHSMPEELKKINLILASFKQHLTTAEGQLPTNCLKIIFTYLPGTENTDEYVFPLMRTKHDYLIVRVKEVCRHWQDVFDNELTQLDLSNTPITDEAIAILSPRLKKLNLRSCNKLRTPRFSHLKKLTFLDLSRCRRLDPKDSEKILLNLPRTLTTLLFKKSSIDLSSLVALLKTHPDLARNDPSFDFSESNLNDTILNDVPRSAKDIKLCCRRFRRRGTRGFKHEITRKGLITFLNNHPHLTKINLDSLCNKVDNHVISLIPQQIEVINFRLCKRLTPKGLIAFFKTHTKIRKANLENTNTNDDVLKAITPAIEVIHLSLNFVNPYNCKKHTDEGLVNFIDTHQNIKVIHYKHYYGKMDTPTSLRESLADGIARRASK